MLLSVSKSYHKIRKELFEMAETFPLTSKKTIQYSQQLDHFVNHYQNKHRSYLFIKKHLNGGELTLHIKGQLDIVTAEQLTDYIEVNHKAFSDIEVLHINLANLTFFDTSGIQALTTLAKKVKKYKIPIHIHTNETTFEVIKMMGIPTILEKLKCNTVFIK